MTATDSAWQRWLRRLSAPRDGAGLGVFRALFGAVMLFGVVRFVANGWVEQLYLSPDFHFTYLGFDWVKPWPPWGMYAHFGLMALSALGLMLGAWTRLSALVFFVAFTYAELIDKTIYLNHYYFVSLVALLLVMLPAGASFSVDARRRGGETPVGLWAYVLVRAQLAIVYFYAGFAKLGSDWLFSAEPLRTWLSAHAHLPLVGPLISAPELAFAMSWAGAFYDLTIPIWLSWQRSRRLAFAAVVLFHLSVWLLFPIGVFSLVMVASTTIFFAPSWPRRWLPPARAEVAAEPVPLGRLGLSLAAGYLALELLVPLRFLAYPGAVNWTEEAFRFSWRVMLIEKTGSVEYEVVAGSPTRRWWVRPRRELTPLQYEAMSTQPDMIHEYALELARRFRAAGHEDVRVFAHAWAALNGRPRQRLIDPSVDLAAEPRGIAPKSWIVPLQSQGEAPASVALAR